MKSCLIATDGDSAASRRGTRRTTSALLAADNLASAFAGLPPGVTRWTVMRALRLAAQGLGLSARELQLLEVYIENTFDADWAAGGEPIVITPVVELAEALGVTERQVRNIEHRLLCRGLITFRDCGNHLRRGRRDPRTGKLVHGYGPSLAPAATRFAEIDALGAQSAKERAATRQSRLAIGALRRRIRADIEALREAGRVTEAEAVSALLDREPARQPAATPLTELEGRRERLTQLASHLHIILVDGDAPVTPAQTSSRVEVFAQPPIQRHKREFLKEGSHSKIGSIVRGPRQPMRSDQDTTKATDIENTKRGHENNAKSAVALPHTEKNHPQVKARSKYLDHGMGHVALHAIVRDLPERFTSYLDPQKVLTWPDLVEAAAAVCRELRIDTATWGDACAALGRNAAAVAVLLLDARTPTSSRRQGDGIVNPAAYLRSMTARGREGRLRLDMSVFALTSRGQRRATSIMQAA